jgi:uncharacterized protein YbbK (DUF523 family)
MTEKSKPVVGISSCLLGDAVRYDGGHKRQNSIVEFIVPKNTIIGFCPEVSAQLGTPRPPVELVVHDSHIEALGRDDSALNVTTALKKVAAILVNKLKAKNAVAYIFKARSPSCGVGTTRLLNQEKEVIGFTDGLVATAILKQLPSLIIVDETAVNDAVKCDRFNAACQLARAHHHGSDIEQSLEHAQIIFPTLKTISSATDFDWQDVLSAHLLPVLNDKSQA